MRIGVVLVVTLGLVSSAIAQSENRSITTPAVTAVDDPLQSFEKIVKRCQVAVEARNTPTISVYFANRTSSWVRRVRAFEVRYDVRKTDSLVAPIVGQIDVLEVIATESAADEQSAASLDFTIASSPSHIRQRYEVRFSWRDQKWSFKDGTSILDFRNKDGIYGNARKSPIDASKGAGYYGPVAECFPL